MRFWNFCAALALGASLCIASDPALAVAPDDIWVEVTLAGSDGDVRALNVALREALATANVRMRAERLETIDARRVSRAAPSTAITAHAPHLWVDRTASDHATLYLTSADGSRVFVREFSLERGLDPVALELLGLVARSSVTAMLAGDSVGVSREEYERTLPSAPPAPPPAPSNTPPDGHSGWHVGSLYELELLNASVVQQGAGAQIESDLGWIALGLVGELRAPFRVGNGPVQAELTSRTARAFVAFPFALSERSTVSLGAAVGVDWIRVEGRENAPGATAEPPFTVTDSVVRSFASFRYRIAALELGALVGAELGLVKPHYFLLSSGEAENVFSPWRLRPLANLSLGARF